MDIAPVDALPPTSSAPSRLPVAIVAAAVAALLAAAYWNTLHWLAGRWWTDPFYSHGALVPIVSAALLWLRRREIRLRPALCPGALALLAVAGALHLLGVRMMFELLSAASLLLALAAVALLAGGPPLLRICAFPLLYGLFALPLPMLVLEKLSLPLQFLSSACAEALFSGLGCPVSRRGVLLVFPEFTLAVADACSGLRSLITVLALSTLAACLTPASPGRKLLLVAAGSIAALAANVLRIVLSGFVGLVIDGETASVFFERYSGFFFFALVVLALLGGAALLGRARPAAEPSPAAPPTPLPPPGLLAAKILLPLAAVFLPVAGAAVFLKAGRSVSSPIRLADWSPSASGWRTVDVRRPQAYPGEERVTAVLEGADDRKVAVTVLHSVSGRYLHSPEACSLAAGWIAELQEVHELPTDGGATLPANLWVLRRGSERVCLVFWFSLGGKPVRGSFDQHLGAMWQRLRSGGIDSAYGEVSMTLPVGTDPPARLLFALAAELHRDVGAVLWPAGR